MQAMHRAHVQLEKCSNYSGLTTARVRNQAPYISLPMARQGVLSCSNSDYKEGVRDGITKSGMVRKFPIVHRRSDPTPAKVQRPTNDEPNLESTDSIYDALPTLHNVPVAVNTPAKSKRLSGQQVSPNTSRPTSFATIDSRQYSIATSASVVGLDYTLGSKATDAPRRPSLLNRLKSSISTFSATSSVPQRPSVIPSDFLRAPEHPERHFIDSVGMVIPGVSNRNRCSHPLSHFVTNWRLCEPIEYTTALADHGITYSDYCRIIAALANFLDEIPNDPKAKVKPEDRWWHSNSSNKDDANDDLIDKRNSHKKNGRRHSLETLEQFKKTEQHALYLHELLADITLNLRARGLPVMLCVGSFSLFAPNRVSEAHVQVLHVALDHRAPPAVGQDHAPGQRLSFVDPFSGLIKTHDLEDHSVSMPRQKLNHDGASDTTSITGGPLHSSSLHLRDRTRPWPLWPNAIPTSKRGLLDAHADRYGVDPYFRAYMRDNINSRTTSASYAKYMIEREDNPFINKRLDYINAPSSTTLLWDLLRRGYKGSGQNPSAINRARYEHNRKLECRKTVEQGSRLRIVRFGFRHPIVPTHTPEMDELGLDKDKYEQIIADIDDIRSNENPMECAPKFLFGLSVNKIRRRSAEEALTKVSEYIRKLNAQQGKVIWTIEKIPGAYDGFFGSSKEWEISAWNGEDPLELLLHLEKWGVIEKKLDIDDDE